MTQKTEFQNYGRAAALSRKAERLGLHVQWLHDSWKVDAEEGEGRCIGKTLDALDCFLKGVEIGLAMAEDDEPRDIEVDEDPWLDEEDPDADEGDDDEVPF